MTTSSRPLAGDRSGLLGLTTYQWTVLLAAWLGWGFDVFDGLLFSFVAPNAVPTLLHLPIGSPQATAATATWVGIMSSVLLLGWAAGGILFGAIADRIGRTRTLLFTVLLYAAGTACCAAAPNLWVLLVFRVIAGLGIGGEWAAGASLVAEVVPEKRRVEAGALLYTAAPMGLFLATYANRWISTAIHGLSPEVSWRYVLLSGLIAAVAAIFIRLTVREPDRWKTAADGPDTARAGSIADLFLPENRARTISGLIPSVLVLISWWSCGAIMPALSAALARSAAAPLHLEKAQMLALVSDWQVRTTNSFDIGGLIGTLLTIPAAYYLGRRRMFAAYLLGSAAAFFGTFGLPLSSEQRLLGYFALGITIFGVFGSFTYYLPELFPTRLRATGAGFCYNVGRIIAAAGPFIVGIVASHGVPSMLRAMFCLGFVPLIGLCLLPWIRETRGTPLEA
jgi:MFS family permease